MLREALGIGIGVIAVVVAIGISSDFGSIFEFDLTGVKDDSQNNMQMGDKIEVLVTKSAEPSSTKDSQVEIVEALQMEGPQPQVIEESKPKLEESHPQGAEELQPEVIEDSQPQEGRVIQVNLREGVGSGDQ